jgi:PAS domain-containing protein
LHTQFPQPREAIEAEALRAGHWEGELVHTRRDGTPVVVASRWAVWQPDHGAPQAIVEISADVTERKQIERSQRLLAEAGPVLAASLDATSRLANIAQVLVPLLADWCVVHITEEGETIQPVAVAHADPQKRAQANDLLRRLSAAPVPLPPTWTRRQGRPMRCAPAGRDSTRKHRMNCSPPSPGTPTRSSSCGRWESSRR